MTGTPHNEPSSTKPPPPPLPTPRVLTSPNGTETVVPVETRACKIFIILQLVSFFCLVFMITDSNQRLVSTEQQQRVIDTLVKQSEFNEKVNKEALIGIDQKFSKALDRRMCTIGTFTGPDCDKLCPVIPIIPHSYITYSKTNPCGTMVCYTGYTMSSSSIRCDPTEEYMYKVAHHYIEVTHTSNQ